MESTNNNLGWRQMSLMYFIDSVTSHEHQKTSDQIRTQIHKLIVKGEERNGEKLLEK